MKVERLKHGDAQRFAYAQVLTPAAFLIFEMGAVWMMVTESMIAFVAVAGWMLVAIMPLTFFNMSRLAQISDSGSAGRFSRDWLFGPWRLAIGSAGRALHQRGGLDPRLWRTQVTLNALALLGVPAFPVAVVALRSSLLAHGAITP